MVSLRSVLSLVVTLLVTPPVLADDGMPEDPALATLEWRCIGPSRGGRASSVAGVAGAPTTYYMGSTGGGVWKTEDAGVRWRNVSDGAFGTGSVGAVAVAPADSNVVYAGTGEPDIRGNFSHGDGVYRTVDAGKTWTNIGLTDSRQIGRIVVHPHDADLVYVAALGHVFGPNAERGVFRSRDGGAHWEKILYVDDHTGAVDIAMDPHNPRVLFAGFWQVRRTPWSLESGGPGSGLYRSTDGGDTWEELTKDLPRGLKGKIGVSVSGAQRDRVYAIIEAEDGGVFRSDDGGDTWARVNQEQKLRQRAWYYTRIYADPKDANTVYVMNVRFHKSIDGGRTWSSISVPHGDNHDLWIDPLDNQRMVNANDGGANVSFNGGRTWSRQDNQPTAQFYHVITDTSFPYRVYGAQQDNSTVSISSRNRLGGRDDFYRVGGGESGYIAPRPDDPNIVYAGSYGGYMTRYDHRLGKSRNITVWPENPMGAGAEDLAHRFQWTFPIVVSSHDNDVLYVAGEVLFRSTTDGASWEIISPDLTTNDKSKQASSGGPITKDNTSVEYYCTIFAVAESPLDADLIWAGTDDGLVHVTEDGGATWTNVTPPGIGDWPLISIIEASPHDADTAYLAVNRYKMDDFRPYVYRTTDRGKSWELVADGIAADAFVRVVREDPREPGVLYAGTETGVWYSDDRGDSWRSLQRNLPAVPITDLVVHENDLVVSTQGRSFWILEDLALVRQLRDGLDESSVRLFAPAPAYRQRWDAVRVHYHVPAGADQAMTLEIIDGTDDDGNGNVVRAYTIDVADDDDVTVGDEANDEEDGDDRKDRIEARPGMNVFRWNFRRPDPVRVPGAIGWPRTPPGPRVPPGSYEVHLHVGDAVHAQSFEVLPDPRLETTDDDYADQVALLDDIDAALTAAHSAVNTIRSVRRQVDATLSRAKKAGRADAVREAADVLKKDLAAIEEQIIQTRSKSPQDPLNYPIRLNDKIGALAYGVDGDYGPTRQAQAVFDRLKSLLDEQLERLEEITGDRVDEFNELVRDERIPAIVIDEAEGEGD